MNLTRRATRAAAFFDVDGTLVDTTTMFDFLAHHLDVRGRSEEYPVFRSRLGDMARSGADRARRCTAYYEMYAGVPVSALAEEGAEWFARRTGRPGFFVQPALAACRSHAAAGDLVVLVSGSFPACLDPVAEHLGADVLLCSRPEVRAGLLTGAIGTPMIGAAKADAVRRLAGRRGLDLERSHAYGDHISDVPYMELVGHPVVVGDDSELAGHAARHGWRRLPGGRRPATLTDRIRP
ncbi:HAD-IB family hydrolase [Streptomyces ziwulingensis]|uniref:HAD-IB family hydrolase n=1 Tax=Streptomyces ziwulingensis TaxID=1045501 RepID=A0ABP9ATE9_9ACTN